MREELEIPEFLIISAADRLAAWQGIKVTHPFFAAKDDAWRREQNVRKAEALQDRRTKNAAALARLKEAHAGQKYNRKLKRWVADEA
jgi:hypothetical protein